MSSSILLEDRNSLYLELQRKAQEELRTRQAARRNLLDFTRYTYPGYQASYHHRLICDALEAVEAGRPWRAEQPCTRLMVFMPPRHGKSELASRRFPPFCLGRDPDREIISASYGSSLATDFGREVRNIIAGPEFRTLFPSVHLAPDSSAKDRWHTNGRGGYVAAGVSTSITGRGANIFNIDDPVKDRQEAESLTTRESIWAWYRAVVYTRLAPKASIVLTMTRWHEDDLAGRLLEQAEVGGDKWEVLCLPAFDEQGRALWPERYDEEDLRRIQRVLEQREWGALYEQNPRPSGSSFFDVERCLVNGQPVEAPGICDTVFAVMDSAVKTGNQHDGTGVIYFGYSAHVGHRLTILDYEIRQIEGAFLENWAPTIFDTLERLARECRARRGHQGLWIEDKQSGTILLQQGRNKRWPVHDIDSKLTAAGKDARAINTSGYVSHGDVKICRAAYDKVMIFKGRAANHMLTQVFRFQLGMPDQADDLLDCFCYGIAIALGNKEGF